MRRLDRCDLLIDLSVAPTHEKWLEPWSWLVHGRLAPRYQNRFGCWFLQSPEGPVEMLDVFFGQIDEVVPSFSAFRTMLNDPSWQEVYLLSELVLRLHEAEKIAAGTDCYALAPPPAASGQDPWGEEPLSTASAMIVENVVLQETYAQVIRRANELGSA